jgi:hypothetical protein
MKKIKIEILPVEAGSDSGSKGLFFFNKKNWIKEKNNNNKTKNIWTARTCNPITIFWHRFDVRNRERHIGPNIQIRARQLFRWFSQSVPPRKNIIPAA